MRVLHTISDLSIKSGGPTTCTYSLLKGLNNGGIKTDVLTYSPDKNENALVGQDFFIKTVPHPRDSKLAYSVNFKNYLWNNKHYDLYHVNAIWQYPSHITSKYARSKDKPYIISPHGMLYPNALEYSKLKKKLFLYLWFQKDLEAASCIHATCEEEMRHIRNLGFKNPIAVIPNPIDVSLVTDSIPHLVTENNIAFLGRLSPIKRIDSLIKAWNTLGDEIKNYNLLIIGDGTSKKELMAMTTNMNITNIKFLGFLKGAEKEAIYDRLKYLILPSESENFGMVVAEALANRTPVIASKGTPWEDLDKYNCGWWVNNDIETLAKAIKEAISVPEKSRMEMGERGRKLILEKYSTEIVAEKMAQLYKWILSGGSKPEFVYL